MTASCFDGEGLNKKVFNEKAIESMVRYPKFRCRIVNKFGDYYY